MVTSPLMSYKIPFLSTACSLLIYELNRYAFRHGSLLMHGGRIIMLTFSFKNLLYYTKLRDVPMQPHCVFLSFCSGSDTG